MKVTQYGHLSKIKFVVKKKISKKNDVLLSDLQAAHPNQRQRLFEQKDIK